MTELRWPRLELSDQRLEELRTEASVADRNAFLALTTQAKILAARGSLAIAKKILQVVDSEYYLQSNDPAMIARFATAAIFAHDPGLAVSWLRRGCSSTCHVTIDPIAASLPAGIVILRIKGNEMNFQLSDLLFRSAGAEMLIGRWATIFPLFDSFMMSTERTDGDVAISLDDGGGRLPGLAFCDYRPGFLLIPDPPYLGTHQYQRLRKDIRENHVPWETRVPVAFWRGSTTGVPTVPKLGWRTLPRIRLSEISAEYPDLIDAGITNVIQIRDSSALADLQSRNLIRPHVGHQVFQQYKYQIDIDGNTNAWSGLFMRLMTGSPVLKVASPLGWQQWYYTRLKPWVNYVPVDPNMEDLPDKVKWLQSNDASARQIGEAGFALAESLGSPEELTHVSRTIAAGIRADAGGPLLDLRFASGASGTSALQDGWLEQDADGVRSRDPECTITLPEPPGFGDYVLLAEVSPADAGGIRLMITADHHVLVDRRITDRGTVYGFLPRTIAHAHSNLTIRFCASDHLRGNSQPIFAEAATTNIWLHRVGIASAHRPTWDGDSSVGALLEQLNVLKPSRDAHDLGWDASSANSLTLPAGIAPKRLQTYFGTTLYADRTHNRIRHGRLEEVPKNFFIVCVHDTALLARLDEDGGYVAVSVRPQGPHALVDNWTPWDGAGFARSLQVVRIPNADDETFGLKGAGLFACAEWTGEFTLSRTRLSAWERFSVKPASA